MATSSNAVYGVHNGNPKRSWPTGGSGVVVDRGDLATLAEDVLDAADLGDRRIHITLEPAVISGDPVLAEHLIANLIDNAPATTLPPVTSGSRPAPRRTAAN